MSRAPGTILMPARYVDVRDVVRFQNDDWQVVSVHTSGGETTLQVGRCSGGPVQPLVVGAGDVLHVCEPGGHMTGQTITLALSREWVFTSNDRPNRYEKARLTKTLRTYASLRSRELAPMDQAHLDVWLTFPTRAGRDPANWMPTLKALVDGLVHPRPGVRGVLPDDSAKYLDGPFPREQRDVLSPPGIILARFEFTDRKEPHA